MTRIFDIALKDLLQLVRDFKTFLFLLVMPILFTILFGYAFGGGHSDPRVSISFLDEDGGWLSRELHRLLVASERMARAAPPNWTARSPTAIWSLL